MSSLTVEYNDDIIQCQQCRIQECSHGKICKVNDCGHTFHITYMIKYASHNRLECPLCKNKVDDIRLSIAIAFQKQNHQELIQILIEDS